MKHQTLRVMWIQPPMGVFSRLPSLLSKNCSFIYQPGPAITLLLGGDGLACI
jgi:hypothetical protein